ncbi:hypothetical protein [Pseudomonas tohonis]|jgi:hypothetical protein|uniref:hypothetical protein n=1 Tax=Pseudomonas tohonis TaxID=2725477 RepID=UPI001F2C74E9|nr:hypothetical protein [Pseudomonas tohonis]
MNQWNRWVFTAFLTTLVAANSFASESVSKEINAMKSDTDSISIPNSHAYVSAREVTMDGERVVLTRYQRMDGRNAELGGEHFSTVVSETGELKGFANISLDLAGKPLPSRERSEQVARDFLQRSAPDLLARMKISWIDPHDEAIEVVRDGQKKTVTLTGMKVKARNLADGRWFWIIVGSDEKPMIFERDIVWITFPGKRKTEKWLHDSWLAEQTTDSKG